MVFTVGEHKSKNVYDVQKSFQFKQGDKCQLKIEAKQVPANEDSSWTGSVSVCTGAFAMLLHLIFHSSIGHLARLTVGVCVVVEVFILVSVLNKYLHFTLTLNIYKILFVRKIILTLVGLILAIASVKVIQITLNAISMDEFLLIILPTLFMASHSLQIWFHLGKNSYAKYLPSVMLVALLGVYW
uniref:Uncharacterized protein n=1 Tax=Ciona savignyi TaxID=51511 RepID=H2ZKR7_CIOSA